VAERDATSSNSSASAPRRVASTAGSRSASSASSFALTSAIPAAVTTASGTGFPARASMSKRKTCDRWAATSATVQVPRATESAGTVRSNVTSRGTTSRSAARVSARITLPDIVRWT
jgi:hypothetical protein